jgi:hypothetical protein
VLLALCVFVALKMLLRVCVDDPRIFISRPHTLSTHRKQPSTYEVPVSTAVSDDASTLDTIVARGHLNCLVDTKRVFWSTAVPGEKNLHRGLAADICLAVAAFIFATPNPANYTNFITTRWMEVDGKLIKRNRELNLVVMRLVL